MRLRSCPALGMEVEGDKHDKTLCCENRTMNKTQSQKTNKKSYKAEDPQLIRIKFDDPMMQNYQNNELPKEILTLRICREM